ncbi:MAG: ABC transporter permease [Chloroflexi bacterium]|nr:ABC transporter permease [Chloroflexota bacterium]
MGDAVAERTEVSAQPEVTSQERSGGPLAFLWGRAGRRALSLILFVAVWEAFAVLNRSWRLINPNLVPAPHEVVAAGVELARAGTLWTDVGMSLTRALEGFAFAAVLGVLIGMLSGYLALFEDFTDPVIELIRPIPPLAFLPMFIIWFGIGELSKVLFITFSCFFPIYLSTAQGVRFTDPILIRAARSLGASEPQVFWHVVLPAALPEIMTGLRLGFGMSLFVLVAAELIAADAGLGYRIQEARNTFRVDVMFLGAFAIGILGYVIGLLLRWLQAYMLRWKSQVN